MNNKGFTLIELIATIALLAVLAVISFVSISGILKKSKINDCNNLVGSIKSVSNEYISDNRYNVTVDESIEKIDGNIISSDEMGRYVLIDAGSFIKDGNNYLFSNTKDNNGNIVLVNPFNNKNFINYSDVKIKIYLNNDYSANEITVMNKDSIEIDCDSETW